MLTASHQKIKPVNIRKADRNLHGLRTSLHFKAFTTKLFFQRCLNGPSGRLVHTSNPSLRLALSRYARRWGGHNGHTEQCVVKWLHAHKKCFLHRMGGLVASRLQNPHGTFPSEATMFLLSDVQTFPSTSHPGAWGLIACRRRLQNSVPGEPL